VPLTDSLISYWKCDEASGNLLDAHGTNELTDNATVGAATGKINGGRDFESGNSEFFSLADNASISVGDIDFTFALWVNLESKAAAQTLVSHWDGPTTQRAWRIEYDSSNDRFIASASGDGATSTTVTANNFGSPSLATWYYLVFWHDATGNTINLQVNNGTADSAAHTAGVLNSTAAFKVGVINAASQFADCVMDEMAFWKRVLTAGEKTSLYGGGAGLAYPLGVTGSGGSTAPASTSAGTGSPTITGTGASIAPSATSSGTNIESSGGSAQRRGRFLLGRRLGLG
jgi:hypothetical protein